MLSHPLADLCQQAAEERDRGHGDTVTFSAKVFLPVTRLCRDTCAYCTFAHPPRANVPAFMTAAEVLAVARDGERAGCTEALLTLGDKPELRYPQATAELAAMGFDTTIEYVRHLCELLLTETSLLPHVNAGVMTAAEIAALRDVSVSQGLMLETTAEAVLHAGGAHANCPDKQPEVRLKTIEDAGALGAFSLTPLPCHQHNLSTGKYWHTTEDAQKVDHFWNCAWAALEMSFRRSLPNIGGATVGCLGLHSDRFLPHATCSPWVAPLSLSLSLALSLSLSLSLQRERQDRERVRERETTSTITRSCCRA